MAEMAGTRGGNRNIFGRIDFGIPTCSMALTPRNHYSLSYNIVLKNLKCSAPFYEAPIRHESCQTTGRAEVSLVKCHDGGEASSARGTKTLPWYKPGQHIRYISAEISRLCQPRVSPSISMLDLSHVGGLVLPLRGMVAHRDDVYRVQSI